MPANKLKRVRMRRHRERKRERKLLYFLIKKSLGEREREHADQKNKRRTPCAAREGDRERVFENEYRDPNHLPIDPEY